MILWHTLCSMLPKLISSAPWPCSLVIFASCSWLPGCLGPHSPGSLKPLTGSPKFSIWMFILHEWLPFVLCTTQRLHTALNMMIQHQHSRYWSQTIWARSSTDEGKLFQNRRQFLCTNLRERAKYSKIEDKEEVELNSIEPDRKMNLHMRWLENKTESECKVGQVF